MRGRRLKIEKVLRVMQRHYIFEGQALESDGRR